MSEKNISEEDDELQPDYDFSAMRIVKRGPAHLHRQNSGVRLSRILLDQDVAEMFPNDQAVNEALRTFIRMVNVMTAHQARHEEKEAA